MAGQLWSWGGNQRGELGQGDTTTRTTPTQVGSLDTWAKISAGINFSIGLRSDGTLWAAGYNIDGELGQGDTTQRSTFTQIGSDTDWTDIACGDIQALALRADGTLWAWGNNSYGQLGLGDTTRRTSPTQVGSATNWIKIWTNRFETIGLRADGTLWSWGLNSQGGLGLGDTTQRNSPTQIGSATTWTDIACGVLFSLALRADGTLWAWGFNAFNQLGLGDTTNRLTPTQVGSATTWSKIAAGASIGLALRADGTLWSWGFNDGATYGAIGQGSTASITTPTQVGTDTDWATVAAGYSFSQAIKTNGTLWVTGLNTTGQLGRDYPTGINVFTQLGSETTWQAPAGSQLSSYAILGAAILPEAIISAASPLHPVRILMSGFINRARIAAPSPLGAPALLGDLARRAPHLYTLTAYLSGGEDCESDFPILLASFGLSKRSAAASYYSITAPFTQALLDAFDARPNGRVHIWRDGRPWESFNVGIPIRFDIGPRSASISISGTRQTTAVGSSRMTAEGHMVISEGTNSTGQLTLGLVPGYLDPRPADVVTWRGADYTVTLKKFNARSDGQTLEINGVPA
jgi:alpha-tubulin suppressor-like RCC1 family protein